MANTTVSAYSHRIEDLLDQFSDDEVISLATTVTGGLLKNKIISRQGAVKAVVNYSEDVPSILRRKLFTKEKLLTYLYEKNVAVKLPITKPEIIKKILTLWKDKNKIHDTGGICSDNEIADPYDSSLDSGASSNCESVETEGNSQQQVVGPVNSDVVGQSLNSEVQNTVITLAEQFSQWFYKLLNENQLTAEHFFPDASLNLTLTSNGDSNTNCVVNDPSGITNSLLTTKTQYDLFLNPNLSSEGLKGQMDPHGLVMVIVCGTLHSKNICVGVFEQMFALARDPSAENNWKVKRTDLRLKSSCNVSGPPKLCETNISSSSNNIAIRE